MKWVLKIFLLTAPSAGGIYPISVQKGTDLIIKYLIKVYWGSVAMGHIAKPCRDVWVVLEPKSDRELSLAKFYYPISLSSFMLKTFERLMDGFGREGTMISTQYRSPNIPVKVEGLTDRYVFFVRRTLPYIDTKVVPMNVIVVALWTSGWCLAGRMAMHACQIGPIDTTPPCPGSPQ